MHSPARRAARARVTAAKGFFYTWGVTLGGYTYVAPTTPTTNPTSFSFTPGQAGTYVVSLSVTDYHGFTSVAATQTIAVAAVAPAVTITGLPAGSVTAGTTVALGSIVTNPSAVLESAGFSESWTIQFDGATYGPYYGPALNLTLGSVGSYTVALDGHGCRGHLDSTTTQDHHCRRHRPGRHARGLAHGTAARAGDHHRIRPWQRSRALVSTTSRRFVTVNWGDGTLATSFPISSQGSLGLAVPRLRSSRARTRCPSP